MYQSDDNYALVGLISMVSLIENNQQCEQINIFYISDNISEKNKSKMLQTIDNYNNVNVNLVFIDASSYLKQLEKLKVSSWNQRIVTWCKLLAIKDISIKEDKLLYINPHTIINKSLDSLFKINLENNVMACVSDLSVRERNTLIEHAVSDDYFNCGLMLINYSLWNKEKLTQYCIDNLKVKSDYQIVDQDFCNVIFYERIKKLPFDTFVFDTMYKIKFRTLVLKIMNLDSSNYYSMRDIRRGLESPRIVYSTFRGTGNPWESNNKAPQRDLWNQYMSKIEMEKRPNSRGNIKRQVYTYVPTLILILRRLSERIKYRKKESYK